MCLCSVSVVVDVVALVSTIESFSARVGLGVGVSGVILISITMVKYVTGHVCCVFPVVKNMQIACALL